MKDAARNKQNRKDLDEDGNDEKRQSVWIPGIKHREYPVYEKLSSEKGLEGWKSYLEKR